MSFLVCGNPQFDRYLRSRVPPWLETTDQSPCFVRSPKLLSVVAGQITSFLENRDLFDPHQFAYKKGHSTQTALIIFLNDVRARDSICVTVSVFFDLRKAFNNVNHRILVEKLQGLNFSCSTLHWICSYLNQKKQGVKDVTTDYVI